MRRILTIVRKNWAWALFALICLVSLFETVLQVQDSRYVGRVARSVIEEAGATTQRDEIVALRNHILRNVSFKGEPIAGRPFLRASAAETLQSGKGYCGEVTRAFICMAASLGIQAQRINLYGKAPHVVAEAELASGESVIVDCQNPPHIADLEPLDELMRRREYTDYSTLNVRRLGIDGIVSRIKLRMGWLTFWSENPHALKAALFALLGMAILLAKAVRPCLRALLHRRGWIHRSNRAELARALELERTTDHTDGTDKEEKNHQQTRMGQSLSVPSV